jgi:predicted solute-binding protein
MVMTEQFLYYTNSEPNIYYTESEINFKKKQNLQKNILIMEAEIKTDKIIYLLFLQQNREEDKFNIETFKLKLQYEISFVNFLKNGERDEQQLNKSMN